MRIQYYAMYIKFKSMFGCFSLREGPSSTLLNEVHRSSVKNKNGHFFKGKQQKIDTTNAEMHTVKICIKLWLTLK